HDHSCRRYPFFFHAACPPPHLHSFPTRRSSDLASLLSSPAGPLGQVQKIRDADLDRLNDWYRQNGNPAQRAFIDRYALSQQQARSEEHTSELQSLAYLVCRLLLEKKKTNNESAL